VNEYDQHGFTRVDMVLAIVAMLSAVLLRRVRNSIIIARVVVANVHHVVHSVQMMRDTN
jgi:hypothetical protein